MASASAPSAPNRQVLTVAAAGLSATALVLCLLRRGSRRKRKDKSRDVGATLGEEVEAAMFLEAQKQGLDVLDLAELQAEFQVASSWVAENGGDLPNEALLALYGCYKQALAGNAPPDRPWGMEAGAKWDAWHKLAGTSRIEALRGYVVALKAAVPNWTPESKGASSGGAKGASGNFGMAVSTMGQMVGEDGEEDDVDETPVGQLNELIHNGDSVEALQVLKKFPDLAFKPDKDGMTPLHWAADSDNSEVMQALLKLLGDSDAAKTRIDAKDADGNTALHFAVMSESQEMARLLVGAGANPDAENEDGETPLQLADGEDWSSIFGGS